MILGLRPFTSLRKTCHFLCPSCKHREIPVHRQGVRFFLDNSTRHGTAPTTVRCFHTTVTVGDDRITNNNKTYGVFRSLYQHRRPSHLNNIGCITLPRMSQRILGFHSLLNNCNNKEIGPSGCISSEIITPSGSSSRFFYSCHSGSGKLSSDSKMSETATGTTSSSPLTPPDAGLSLIPGIPACEVALMNDAKNIFNNAVVSVLPKEMVAEHLLLADATGDVMTVKGETYLLSHNVYVIGFGKAVLGMARALDDLIGRHVVKGVVSVPQGTREEFRNAGKTEMLLGTDSAIEVREGASNNMPDPLAHAAALEIADIARSVREGDLLVVLISGGGSALLPAPTPPITLDDMLSVTGHMSRGGATISQLNTVRKQLDFLKGGGLARMAYPAQVVSLILSDIVGDPIDLIASAPTVRDNSSPDECLSIFSQLNITHNIPCSVIDYLKEKSKMGNNSNDKRVDGASISKTMSPCKLDEFSHVQNLIIGSNKIACERACQESITLGYNPFVLSTELEGEAKEVGKMFSNLAVFIALNLNANISDRNIVNIMEVRKRLVSFHGLTDSKLDEIVVHVNNSKMATQGVCIVSGGETTVTVNGTGRGGRNQEMATSVGLELDSLLKEMSIQFSDNIDGETGCSNPSTHRIVFLSAGTDGQDGPTPAAGGVVGGNFARSVRQAGLNPSQYLDNNDCFSLLDSWAGGIGLVNTGLTGTNVMDLQVLMVKQET